MYGNRFFQARAALANLVCKLLVTCRKRVRNRGVGLRSNPDNFLRAFLCGALVLVALRAEFGKCLDGLLAQRIGLRGR
jgi:hypothetical protein